MTERRLIDGMGWNELLDAGMVREDATQQQYEAEVKQWWRDPEYEEWLDELEQQRKDEDD